MNQSAPATATDADLIQQTLAGDREAFGELALRYEVPLYRHLAKLMGHREDAEELAQEALLRAYRGLPQFRRHHAFGPWLFCIATNLARDAHRRRNVIMFDAIDDVPEMVDTAQRSATERIDSARAGQRLQHAIEQLPPFLQSILNLHYREEMKLSQIAEIFQRDAKSIAMAMHRARAKLCRMLNAEDNGGKSE